MIGALVLDATRGFRLQLYLKWTQLELIKEAFQVRHPKVIEMLTVDNWSDPHSPYNPRFLPGVSS